MHLEVEMKAWVRNPRELEANLYRLGAQFERDFRKEDRYFRFVERNAYAQKTAKQDVRIRMDGYTNFVTYKDKRLENGMEINDEHEFEVSDSGLMSELLHRLGAEDLVEKIKIGSAWRWGELLVETSEVLGLGHFVEIEQVLVISNATEKNEQQEKVQRSQTLIRDAFSLIGIPSSDLEERSYTSMLTAIKRAGRELTY